MDRMETSALHALKHDQVATGVSHRYRDCSARLLRGHVIAAVIIVLAHAWVRRLLSATFMECSPRDGGRINNGDRGVIKVQTVAGVISHRPAWWRAGVLPRPERR